MKTMKQSLSMLMALLMVFSLLAGIIIPANAATVDYQYGSYGDYSNVIKNWGTRGELATFLSPKAKTFYQGTSYESLASKAGSSDITVVNTSALYIALSNLMTKAHTTKNTYGDIRYLSKFTDIEKNGSVTEKISSFYSGTLVGPDWDWNTDRTWTREHTWPDSKGGSSNTENDTNDNEADIMMVRPVPLGENSRRSNTAYGVSSGYYYPNKESDGKYDVRGDVARTVLYVYVRWGTEEQAVLDNMWGTAGVIESKEVLLTWMEEDPVDTWEMGRNDSVQSITGTRNVFVDYPELAFELFEKDVPNMTTPSGIADGSAEPEITEPEPTEQPEATEPDATEAPADGYELITLDSVTEGNYLIGAVRSQTYPNVYLATGTITSGYMAVADSYVTAQSDAISVSQASGAKVFTFTGDNTDGFTIGYHDGSKMVYLGYTDITTSNKLAFGSQYSNIKWTVQEVTSGGFALYTTNGTGKYAVSQNSTTINAIRGYKEGKIYKGIYLFAETTAECKHTDAIRIDTEPTCTEQGYTTYFCADCGEELYVEDYVAALGHSYQAVITKPTLSAQGYTTYTCSVCKDSYKDSYTAPLTNVDSWGLALGSDLIVKFNIYVDSAIRANASVQITVADDTETYDTKNLTFSQNLCQVSVRVAAAQMTDTITVKLINGSESISRTYTVLSYAKTILAGNYDAATKTLVREMLNYGAAAQTYFDYKADALANAGVTGMETAGKEDVPAMAETDISVSGQLADLNFYGASLVYRDKIAVRFYFTGSVDGVDFGGKTAVLKDSMYYVEIGDILPQNLNQQITLTATDAAGNTLTVSYSPMNYIVRMNQKDNANLQNLMKALYNYYLAAKAIA